MTTAPGPDTARTVFLNCPFDRQYEPLLDAIVFTCVHAGFFPLIASSSGSVAAPRLERILTSLAGARFSIHDLSRCHGEGDENLARFNMPLELGMAMAIRGVPADGPTGHDYLILVPDEAHAHQRFISDLSGLDLYLHDHTPQVVSARVLKWLVSLPEAPTFLSPKTVLPKLVFFGDAMNELRQEWRGGPPPWRAIIEAAERIAAE
ncbi:MAG TPA: hypothetical protein VF715_14830 [Thermoleophilaceae bacterium]